MSLLRTRAKRQDGGASGWKTRRRLRHGWAGGVWLREAQVAGIGRPACQALAQAFLVAHTTATLDLRVPHQNAGDLDAARQREHHRLCFAVSHAMNDALVALDLHHEALAADL